MPFIWDDGQDVIRRIEYIPSINALVSLSISQVASKNLHVRATSPHPINKQVWEEIVPRLSRSLSINEDITPIRKLASRYDKNILDLLNMGGGRLLRGTTFFEDTIKTLLTTNASWEFTRSMVRNLIMHYGHRGAFPCPADLSNISEGDFRANGKIGYRARYMVAMVKQFLAAGTDELPRDTRFLGLGDYGAVHADVLRGDYSRIPIDSEVRSYCKSRHKCYSDSDINARFKNWGAYAFLGYKLNRQAHKLNWIGEKRSARRS